MEEFPPNSHTAKRGEVNEKAEPKKVERVVTGGVIRRKKSLGTKLSETFIGGDARGAVGYIIQEVLIPAAKDAVADAMTQGVERVLFGEARSTSRRPSGRSGNGTPHTPYNRYSYRPPTQPDRREDTRVVGRRPKSIDIEDIILPTRPEAVEVIDRMFDLVSRYEVATVSDLYDLVGESSDYTDEKYGWYDMRGSDVVRDRGGYRLKLPAPEPLN